MTIAIESLVIGRSDRCAPRGAAFGVELLRLLSLRVDPVQGFSAELRAKAWAWIEGDDGARACKTLRVDHAAYVAQLKAKVGAA